MKTPASLPEIKTLNLLIKKLSTFDSVQEVYLFGSRARGDEQSRSDIDIAVVCPKISDTDWSQILKLTESIPTLLKIDCVRFDKLKDENPLRQAILRDKVILYKKGDLSMDPVMQEFFQKTEKALTALEIVTIKPAEKDRINIDATIQRFEFTIELFWKLLKKILLTKGVTTQYPRDVLQEAYAGSLIDDEQMWIRMLDDRNQTSHTYDEDLANQIYERIKTYTPIFRNTLMKLKEQFLS